MDTMETLFIYKQRVSGICEINIMYHRYQTLIQSYCVSWIQEQMLCITDILYI